ncbi:unnamed protein product, partial [Symbiodinium necroappetens]
GACGWMADVEFEDEEDWVTEILGQVDPDTAGQVLEGEGGAEDQPGASADSSAADARDDWSAELERELRATASDDDAVGNPSGSLGPLRRGRGRPRGSAFLHAHLKAAVQDQDNSAVVVPQLGVAERLAAGRAAAALQKRKDTDDAAAAFGPERLLTSLGPLVQRTVGAALTHSIRKIPQRPARNDAEQKTFVQQILEGDVLTCSASSVARLAGRSKSVVQSLLLQAGSAVVESAGLLWSVMASTCLQAVTTSSTLEPIMICVSLRYDETPTKVRVASVNTDVMSNELGQMVLVPRPAASTPNLLSRFLQHLNLAPASQRTQQTATHAKILQTQVDIGMLFLRKHAGEKRFAWVVTPVPTALQAMQRSTGEVQLACVLESFSSLGGLAELRRVSNAFPCRVKITTTDRYSANYRTEEGLRAHLEGFEFVHLACDCRRCSSAIGNSLKSVQSDVSGAINTALALSDLGSVKVLRDILTAIMFEELEIHNEAPPPCEYRDQAFALFLPVDGGVPLSVQKINRGRRFILKAFLNGQIDRTDRLDHYCPWGCCRDAADTLSLAALYCTWALVPFACPVLCRKSWLNQMPNLHFLGVLESHHGLRVRMLRRLLGGPTKEPTRRLAPAANDWDQELQAALGAAAGAEDQEGAAAAAAEPEAVAGEQSEASAWALENARRRNSAKAYAESKPYDRLVVFCRVLAPMHQLMARFLTLSGKNWMKKQKVLAAQGKPRSWPVLEAARLTDVTACLRKLLDIMLEPLLGARGIVAGHTRALKFLMTSAGMCGLRVYLRLPRQNFPYRLFTLLDDASEATVKGLKEIPPCLRDEFTNNFIEKGHLETEVGLAILEAAADILLVDVAGIESGHSTAREFASLRSRGWVPTLETLASRFVLQERQRSLGKIGMSQFSSSKRKSDRPKRKNPGGGGAWRAFASEYLRGRKLTAALATEMSRIYRRLSDAEMERYITAGRGGTLAHRQGFPSFGRQPRQRSSMGMAALEQHERPGEERQDGALVAADLERADFGLVPYAGDTLAERYADFKVALKEEMRHQQQLDESRLSKQEVEILRDFEHAAGAEPVPAADVWSRDMRGHLLSGLQPSPATRPRMASYTWCAPAEQAAEACERGTGNGGQAIGWGEVGVGCRAGRQSFVTKLLAFADNTVSAPFFTQLCPSLPNAMRLECVCVCSDPDPLHFCRKLQQWMKKVFHKVNNTACEARKLLESQMVVLEYRTVEAQEPAPGSMAASGQVLYGHVGHINFSTWHHVLLRLTAEMEELGLPSDLSESTGALQVGAFPAESAGAALGIFSDLQFYQQLDLKRAWEIRPHVISVLDKHWHSMDSSASAVPLLPLSCDPDESIPESCSWLGSEAEKAIRQAAEDEAKKRQAGKKRRGAGVPASFPPGKLMAKQMMAVVSATSFPDEGDQVSAASKTAEPAEPYNPYLEPLQDPQLDPDGEPVATEMEEHWEKSSLGSVESDIAASEMSLREAEGDLPADRGDQDLLLELEQEFQGEVIEGAQVPPTADAADVGLDLEVPVSLPARAAVAPRAAGGEGRVPGARAPALPRARGEQADRTCKPTQRDISSGSVLAGQGRPVGLLMNWLELLPLQQRPNVKDERARK